MATKCAVSRVQIPGTEQKKVILLWARPKLKDIVFKKNCFLTENKTGSQIRKTKWNNLVQNMLDSVWSGMHKKADAWVHTFNCHIKTILLVICKSHDINDNQRWWKYSYYWLYKKYNSHTPGKY